MSRREAFEQGQGLTPEFLAPSAPEIPTPGTMPRKERGHATRTHTSSGRPRNAGAVLRQNMGDVIKPIINGRGIGWAQFSGHLYRSHGGTRTQAVTWAHDLLQSNPEEFHAFLDQIKPRQPE